MPTLYHHTDTARLAWILQSGELRPGANKVGGFPDPDFLWATTDSQGDFSASADIGENYKKGEVLRVRIACSSDDFFPWHEVATRFPQWTPEQIERLERYAAGKSSPLTWWCRVAPLPITNKTRIELKYWSSLGWRLLKETVVLPTRDGWLGLPIGQIIFMSKRTTGPKGQVAYQVQTLRPGDQVVVA